MFVKFVNIVYAFSYSCLIGVGNFVFDIIFIYYIICWANRLGKKCRCFCCHQYVEFLVCKIFFQGEQKNNLGTNFNGIFVKQIKIVAWGGQILLAKLPYEPSS